MLQRDEWQALLERKICWDRRQFQDRPGLALWDSCSSFGVAFQLLDERILILQLCEESGLSDVLQVQILLLANHFHLDLVQLQLQLIEVLGVRRLLDQNRDGALLLLHLHLQIGDFLANFFNDFVERLNLGLRIALGLANRHEVVEFGVQVLANSEDVSREASDFLLQLVTFVAFEVSMSDPANVIFQISARG